MYQGECKLCGKLCSSCTIPANENDCTACKIFSAKSGSTCECTSGFGLYWPVYAHECMRQKFGEECALSCDDCSAPNDESSCTSCLPFSTLTAGSCVCNPGYGRIYFSRCGPCHPRCLTCQSDSFTQCTSCSCSNCNVLCECYYGYMTYNNKQCNPCHSFCGTCDGPGMNNCLSCESGRGLTLISGHCVCTSSGQYMAVSVSPYNCQPCHASCAKCAIKPDLCLECSSISQLTLNRNRCDCPRGYTFNTNKCVLVTCHSNCMAPDYCNTNLVSGCLMCLVGAYMNPSGTCVATDGFTYTTTLTACHSSCLTCSTAASNSCIYCKRNAISPAANNGVCDCPMGMVFSALPATLGDCVYICNDPDCSMCTGGAGTCSACKGELILSGNQCFCPTGKYKVGLGILCRSCHQSCSTCTGPSKTSCVACKPGLSLVGSECKCGSGTFMD
jgi:proprotein convertase subtilisin/kexin type 5